VNANIKAMADNSTVFFMILFLSLSVRATN
jgi:hypothetical protein